MVAKKTVKKKASSKKTSATKKVTRKKTAAKVEQAEATAPAKKTRSKKGAKNGGPPLNRGQLTDRIAELSGVEKKDVKKVLGAFAPLFEEQLKGVGVVNLNGLMKIQLIHKPATKERKGVSPFTGEETVFKAKPARNVVKIKALKTLKNLAA